eukprot:g939.t1
MTKVTHLRPQIGWTEGLDTPDSDSSVSAGGLSPKQIVEDEKRRKTHELDEEEMQRRRQWEADALAKRARAERRMRRKRRTAEDRLRRERARAEAELREKQERDEELYRWEAEEAERRARERVLWEEETLARQEVESAKCRWHEEEAVRRCRIKLEFEETEQKLATERWQEKEARAARHRAEEAAIKMQADAKRRIHQELREQKDRWEAEERERSAHLRAEWEERLSPKTAAAASSRVEAESAAVSDVHARVFPVGNRVEVRYGGGAEWFPATVRHCSLIDGGESVHRVEYDNGEIEENVSSELIRELAGHSSSYERRDLRIDTTPNRRLDRFRNFETPQKMIAAGSASPRTPVADIISTSTAVSSPSASATSQEGRSERMPRQIARSTSNINIGGYLWKIPRRTRSVPKVRWFRIERVLGETESDKDELVLAWYDREPKDTPVGAKPQYAKRSKSRQVPIANVFELRFGHSTDAFAGQIEQRGVSQLPPSRMCFSLVANTRTIDLAACDDASMQVWVKGLGDLVARRGTIESTLRPSIAAPRQAFSEKQRRRWRRKMGKYVRQSNLNGIVKLMKEGCPADIALDTSQSADATIDTGLLLSCQAGNAAVARLLLNHGAAVDPHPDVGGSALHCAASAGHVGCVRVILESDAEYSIDDPLLPSGDTPLQLAARGTAAGVVELLLKHGAVVTQRNARGLTALHSASKWGRSRIVAIILKHAESSRDLHELIAIGDEEGNTALHLSATQGHIDVVSRLLTYGASTLALNRASQTPAQAAKRANCSACVAAIMPKQREEELRTFATAACDTDIGRDARGAIKESTSSLFDGLTISRTPRRVASSPQRYSNGTYAHALRRDLKENHTPRFYGLDYDRHGNDASLYGQGERADAGDNAVDASEWELWEVAYTEEGHRYFYNRSTGESQWEDPRFEAAKEDALEPPDTARDRHHPLVPHLRLGSLSGGGGNSGGVIRK